MDWTGLAALVGAIGGIASIILVPIINARIKKREREFEHDLEVKDKETEHRLTKLEVEDDRRIDEEKMRISHAYSHLYGYLWSLLYSLNADRVSVIQPHPADNHQYISESLEVIRPSSGASEQKRYFQNKRMSEWAGAIKKWIDNDFVVYSSTNDIKDEKIYSEACRRGVKAVIFKRVMTPEGRWRGTVCVDYIHDAPADFTAARQELATMATLINDILPEYTPIKNEWK